MKCTSPRWCYEENGVIKRQTLAQSQLYMPGLFQVPCGECIACRLNYARDWAIRCTHEASLHEQNSFVTLTFNDENLPKDGSVRPSHISDFMRKLRKKIQPRKVRFYGCGEYGSRLGRCHYHILLFGYDFADKSLWKSGINRTGRPSMRNSGRFSLYTSKELEGFWQKGFTTTGEVTLESAGYVARYIGKKINGVKQLEHYGKCKMPEFALMSRAFGIGKKWYEKYKTSIYPKDFITIDGVKFKPPRYYDKLFMRHCAKHNDWKTWEKIKEKRKEHIEDRKTHKEHDYQDNYYRKITKPLVRQMERIE